GIEAAKKYSPVYLQFSPETDTTDSKNDLTDGYPIIKPIHMTSCENGNVEYMPGSVVGNMSRCLKGKDLELKEENEYGLTVRGICAYVNCEDGKVKVKYSGTDNWHVCNNDNSVITPEGGSAFRGGSILCPKYAEVCTELNSTIDFRITYDEDEKRLMEEEDKQEAEEEKQRIMAQEESEGEALQQKNEQEEAKSREGKLASQTQPQPSIPALAVGQRGLAVAGNANGASHVPTTPSNAGNQRGSPIGVSEKEVVQPSSAASEQHIERREKQAHESKTNNNGDHSQRQPSISAPNVPSDTKRPEMEKNSSEPAKAQDKEVSISEISKPAASESVVVSGHTPSVEEDHNNTTENIEQVQGISTQSPSQNGNDEGINTTVDTTHSPNRPATDNEKEETIVNTDNNTTNTTTSSIPENVNASVAPATLTGPNKTQMGQVINQATAIVIAGADSSIATSYQIPLLLIVSALVALASP
ncbi:putative surface protease GP63, putative,metallopeptidase, partial [Trypanosoma theileri]